MATKSKKKPPTTVDGGFRSDKLPDPAKKKPKKTVDKKKKP